MTQRLPGQRALSAAEVEFLRAQRQTRPEGGPVIRDSFSGGIADITESQVGNVGANTFLNTPTAASPFDLTTDSALWGLAPLLPKNAVATVVLQTKNQSQAANPRALIVTIDPPALSGAFETGNLDIKARLRWGCGGDLNEVIVDAIIGTQVTLVATDMTIEGIYTLVSVPPAPIVKLGASLGYGSRAGHSFGPSFTARVHVQNASNVAVQIPSYAHDVTILTIDDTTDAQVAADIIFDTADHSADLAAFHLPIGMPTPIGIPNGAGAIFIKNPNANPFTATVRFGLAL